MSHKLFFGIALLSATLGAQTLTLISGNGQLQPANTGYGGEPVVFKVTSSTDPNSAGLPGQVIQITSSNGVAPFTAVTLTTDSNGMASAIFVPPPQNGESSYSQYTLTATTGSAQYVFYETAYYVSPGLFPDAAANLISPVNLVQGIYNTTAGVKGTPIQISVFTSGGPQGGQQIGNVSVHPVLIPPFGSQTVRCAEANPIDYEGDVWSSFLENSLVTCTPVFSLSNQALAGQQNSYQFQMVAGDNFVFGPIRYNVAPAPLLVTGGLVNGEAPYSAPLVVTGGAPPYTFAVVGGTLPSGLTLNAQTGAIMGTTTASSGIYSYSVRVTDSAGASVTIAQSIAVSSGNIAPSVSVLTTFVGEQVSQAVAITGGVTPLKITSVTGLPAGLTYTLQSNGILISGVAPSLTTPVVVTIAGTDATGAPFGITFDLQAVPALSLTSANPQTIIAGSPFSEQIVSSGGDGVTYAATGLPPGLSISATGLISGTVPAGTPAQAYLATVTATDTLGESKQIMQTLYVEDTALVINPASVIPAFAGLPYQTTLLFTGGVPAAGATPYTIALGQNPPAGVTLQNGVLSGLFPTAGTVTVPLVVTDATGTSATPNAVITVQNVAFVNAASFNNDGFVAPGEIVSIFGAGFGPASGVSGTVDPTTGFITTTDSGVQVLFNNTPAPLLYVNATQINAVVPYEVTAGTPASVVVSINGANYTVNSALPVNQSAPGIFAIFPSGYTAGAPVSAVALNVVGNNPLSINSATNAVPRGDYIVLYATGGGTLSAPLSDGQEAGTDPLITITDPVTATIGGQAATVSFIGEAPGFVGLIQINVLVPQTVTPGPSVPVVVTIGSNGSSAEVATIAVQ